MKTLSINGQSLSAYGIYISSDTYLNAPSIDYTEYQIPARDGSLFSYNKRLNDVVRKFTCYIPDGTNVSVAMQSLKALLYSNIGELKLESDYTPNYYQLGNFIDGIEVEPFNLGRTATFELYFSCRPYQFERVETTIDLEMSQLNATVFSYESSPFIKQIMKKVQAPYQRTGGRYIVEAIGKSVPSTACHIQIVDPDFASLGVPCFVALAIVSGDFPNYKLERLLSYGVSGGTRPLVPPTNYQQTQYKIVPVVEYLPQQADETQYYLKYYSSPSTYESIDYPVYRNFITVNGMHAKPLIEYTIEMHTTVTDVSNAESSVSNNDACIMIDFEKMYNEELEYFLNAYCKITGTNSFKLYYDTATGDAYVVVNTSGAKRYMNEYMNVYGDFTLHDGDIVVFSRVGWLLRFNVMDVKLIYRGMAL